MKTDNKIFVFGAGGHASVVIDVLEKQGKYDIIGIIDSKRTLNSTFNDYVIIGRQEQITEVSGKYNVRKGIICIGDNYLRGQLRDYILNKIPHFEFVNAIHPSSVISEHVMMGTGNVIMPGVVINRYAEIGDQCILNSNSVLEHNCVMKNFSSLSVGVSTGGHSVLEEFAAVSIGAILFDRIRIGKHSVIGAGAVVNKNIPPFTIAYGVPAKIIRNRKEGEKYLN